MESLSKADQFKLSHILSVLFIIAESPELTSFLSRVPQSDLVTSIKHVLKSNKLNDFKNELNFLSPSHFVSSIFTESIISIKKTDLYSYSKLHCLRPCPSDVLIYLMPRLDLIENLEGLRFIDLSFAGYSLAGGIFGKNRYFIAVAKRAGKWVLQKVSGMVKFENWGLASASCYENGFVVKSVFYVRKEYGREPEESSNMEDQLRMICDCYASEGLSLFE